MYTDRRSFVIAATKCKNSCLDYNTRDALTAACATAEQKAGFKAGVEAAWAVAFAVAAAKSPPTAAAPAAYQEVNC